MMFHMPTRQISLDGNHWRHFMKYWGGGASAKGLVRFIGPFHGRGIGGHAPTGIEIKILKSTIFEMPFLAFWGIDDDFFLVDYFRR